MLKQLKIFILLGGIIFSQVCLNTVWSQVYSFKNYKHKDGLNVSSIISIGEDQSGYIWLGTDGAGLVRFDGEEFDYLTDELGRSRRHISAITFSKKDFPIIGTQYRGVYTLENFKEEKLEYVSQFGQVCGIHSIDNRLVVIQDAAIQVFKGEKVEYERKIYPLNEKLDLYGKYKINNQLFLFTSRGNFVVNNHNVENLSDWLGTSEQVTKKYSGLIKSGDSIRFISKNMEKELTILMDNGNPKFFIEENIKSPFLEKDERILFGTHRGGLGFFISNKNRLFKWKGGNNNPEFIINNSDEELTNPTGIHIDKNYDIWIPTNRSGVFRASKEPFTAVKIHPVYEKGNIMFVHKTDDDLIIISTSDKETFISHRYEDDDFDQYELLVKSASRHNGVDYLATNQGLYKVDKNRLVAVKTFEELNDKSLTLVYSDGSDFYVAEEGGGLCRVNFSNNSIENIEGLPKYIYRAEVSFDESKIYFGTNVGVISFDKKNEEIEKIKPENDEINLGYYSGNSTRDKYGNIWFSLDEGIIAILKSGEIKAIYDEKYIPSNLIYTLSSDRYGNILVGTNKGITIINVSDEADPKSVRTYSAENGFTGYETNMRSDYKNEDGHIYVGTIEGLYLIRPEFFQRITTPKKPVITKVTNSLDSKNVLRDTSNVFSSNENSFAFHFRCINVKSKQVRYSYRLLGLSDEWSPLTKATDTYFTDLPGGNFVFQVKATINDEEFSQVSSYSFKIHTPFYKTRWFILSGIALIIILNFYILEKTKRFNRQNIILSQDLNTSKRTASSLLLFGAFANFVAHLFAERMDSEIATHYLSLIIGAVIVFILFLLLTFTEKFRSKAAQFLMIGYLIVLGQNLFTAYYSSLHPFHLTAILITLMVTPVVFRSLKSVILLVVALIGTSFFLTSWIEDTYYNNYLFITAVGIGSLLTVLLTYIRNNSLEKLIFTSGIVNKGNILVVAFKADGTISYVSENISEVLDIESSELKGLNVSQLNQFQPETNNVRRFKNVNLSEEFKENKIFTSPLFSKSGDLIYYQWSCKMFSGDVRVILGQDVTEKINLESYYELIVNNADDLIYQTNAVGEFKFVNNKCLQSFKYKENELLGKSFDMVIHPNYKARVKRFYRDQLNSKDKHSYLEFKIINGQGETRWLGQNVTTLIKPGTEDVVTGFLGLARDITERKKANLIIQEQNKDIKASINYARRIQFNMLPRSAQFELLFKEHLLLFKPKDIVSGDFYWLDETENKIVLVCSDCTGHGVPGAFMTLLGIDIINQIVKERNITNPGVILDELDERLMEVLPRDGRNRIHDGMEISVCTFDKKSHKVEYATGGARFVKICGDTGELELYKLDNKHIGQVNENDKEKFKYATGSIEVKPDDTLYMFSDGYPDQFGGERNKKLSIKKFIALLSGVYGQPLDDQSQIFQEHLKEWIGENPQTDDITLIGIRGVRQKKNEADLPLSKDS